MPIIGDRPEISINAVIYSTDFSASSENAGNFARLLAGCFSAPLLVTHSFLLERAAEEVEQSRGIPSQQREHLKKMLAHRAAELNSGSVAVVPTLIDGNPAEAIPALAEKHAPALIVLGTHGAGRIEHGLIGSVAEKILRSTRWPCVTVGPQVPKAPAAGLPFSRVLYATDLSPEAANAALFALAFAQTSGGTVDVLNVLPENSINNPDRLAALEKQFYEEVDKLVPEDARQFCNPQAFVEVGNAHDRIFEHIQKRNIDLLVLGIRKSLHLGFEMRTSGAYRLLADAPCPVLTITA